jgi:transcriptional regulator GlxA family with amidase domain
MISGGQIVTEALGNPDFADPIDTLIVPGGAGIIPWSLEKGALRWMRRHCLAARRVCATGGGVFLLAAAGLLNGRRAVTRWDVAPTLEADYPETKVEHGPTYIRDGRFWTGAGSTSAVDVGLAMVEEDLGRGIAMRIARQMVLVTRRSAEQPQLSTMLRAQSVEEDIFDGLHSWVADNLGGDLRLEQLASHVGMSTRNFVRRYSEVVGSSPAKTVERMRVEAARQALEASDGRVECIAHQFGFSSADVFRRVFIRHTGKAPREFRAACRDTQAAA